MTLIASFFLVLGVFALFGSIGALFAYLDAVALEERW